MYIVLLSNSAARRGLVTLTPEKLEALIFGTERFRRFTQDSGVMPDVWIAYGRNPTARLDLLLSPHVEASAPALGHALEERLGGPQTRLERPEEVRVLMLVDRDSGTGLGITLFETEDALRRGHEALDRMTPPVEDSDARRTSVEFYEVAIRKDH